MRCKFCFATFKGVKHSILPKGHLPQEEALEVVRRLAAFGFQKITFAGGEPTLCPWLSELIALAKSLGMTTMIVTNGTGLSEEFLKINRKNLDWIAISIDSLRTETNLRMGRAVSGSRPNTLETYVAMIESVKAFGYGLKINTVVNRVNLEEDLVDFIRQSKPLRWKILQVIPIREQNDEHISDFLVSHSEFEAFVERHQGVDSETVLVVEPADLIKGSYIMVDPAGRFFDNTSEGYRYSGKIHEIGCAEALREVKFDFSKFLDRGGRYSYSIGKP